MRTSPPALSLRQRYLSPRQARALPWVIGVMMLTPVALPLLAIFCVLPSPHLQTADELFSAWLALLSQAWTRNWGDALQLGAIYVVLGVQLWYGRLAERWERLTLDASGIRYRSPLPAFLSRFKPSWSLRWEDLRSVGLSVSSRGSSATVLVLDTGARQHRLMPCRWIDADTPTPRDACPKPGFLRASIAGTRTDVEQSPLLRYLAAAGIVVGDTEAGSGFSLENNSRSKAAVAVLFTAMAYALGDTFFVLQETYAGSPYWEVYTVAGALAALASAAWMRHGKVPLAESLGVGLMVGGVCGAALYPGLLRINQLTDTRGLHTVEYHSTAPGAYAPLREGRPMLEFDDNAEYWAQFPAGSIYRFELRRGGLGFYQINLAPIHEDMRSYFEGKRNAGTAAKK